MVWMDIFVSHLLLFMLQFFKTKPWVDSLGGCCLDRDTLSVLRDAAKIDGGWEVDNLERLVPWSPLSWVIGDLKKKSWN